MDSECLVMQEGKSIQRKFFYFFYCKLVFLVLVANRVSMKPGATSTPVQERLAVSLSVLLPFFVWHELICHVIWRLFCHSQRIKKMSLLILVKVNHDIKIILVLLLIDSFGSIQMLLWSSVCVVSVNTIVSLRDENTLSHENTHKLWMFFTNLRT